MATGKKRKVLFITDEHTAFDTQTVMFQTLFDAVDIARGRHETLRLFNQGRYDIVIGDLSTAPEEVGVLKQLKDMQPGVTVFAMVSPKDGDKLYGIADLGIHAFELTPEQFDLALQAIAEFDPSAR